jgi:hypothetical protein
MESKRFHVEPGAPDPLVRHHVATVDHLGAELERESARELVVRESSPSDPLRGFQEPDPQPGRPQTASCGEAAESGADDNRVQTIRDLRQNSHPSAFAPHPDDPT